MIVGGVNLATVDELRMAAAATAADCCLHDLLTDAITSAVHSLRLVQRVLAVVTLPRVRGFVMTIPSVSPSVSLRVSVCP